jgi:hypothetical protein
VKNNIAHRNEKRYDMQYETNGYNAKEYSRRKNEGKFIIGLAVGARHFRSKFHRYIHIARDSPVTSSATDACAPETGGIHLASQRALDAYPAGIPHLGSAACAGDYQGFNDLGGFAILCGMAIGG